MRIRTIGFNNRKKAFEVTTSLETLLFRMRKRTLLPLQAIR